MKLIHKLLLLLLLFLTIPIKIGNCQVVNKPSPVAVKALNKMNADLKTMWKQKIKDASIYKKMQEYQEGLTKVYKTSQFLKQTKSILDLIDLIELYACRIRAIHEYINNDNLNIPNSCGFEFNYQKSMTAFSMSLDLVDLIMKDVQMTINDRMEHLKTAKEKLIQAEKEIGNLTYSIIKFNL